MERWQGERRGEGMVTRLAREAMNTERRATMKRPAVRRALYRQRIDRVQSSRSVLTQAIDAGDRATMSRIGKACMNLEASN